MILLPFILAPFAGIWLLVIGWRGRRLDDHPLCRRCGFDLTGKPSTTDRCAECGTLLTAPRAVRLGHTVRLRGLFASGIVVLSVWVVFSGVGLWVQFGHSDLTPYKPVWWLRRESAGADHRIRDIALAELSRRIVLGRLSNSQVDDLMSDVLRIQPSGALSKMSEWGLLVDTARRAKQISAKDWVAYAQAGLTLTVKTRPQIRQGDPVPLAINIVGSHMGNEAVFANLDWINPKLDDLPPRWRASNSGSLVYNGGGCSSMYGVPEFSGEQTAALSPGEHVLSGRLRIRVLDGEAGAPMGSFDTSFTVPFQLVRHDAPIKFFAIDPDEVDRMQKSVSIPRAWMPLPRTLEILVVINKPPMGFAHDVYVRAGGQEKKIGELTTAAPGNDFYPYTIDDPGVDQFDLIFRPNEQVAVREVDPWPRWGGTIVIPNIPVQRHPIQPATESAILPSK